MLDWIALLQVRALLKNPNTYWSRIEVFPDSYLGGYSAQCYQHATPSNGRSASPLPMAAGHDQQASRAILKCASEAVERFAFDYCLNDTHLYQHYGFHLDPSTTGMAAMPAIYPIKKLRLHAYFEALERWGIVLWARGQLPFIVHEFHIEILTPIKSASVVISFLKGQYLGIGFAAKSTLNEALRHATMEALRMQHNMPLFDQATWELTTWEKRALNFSRQSMNQIIMNVNQRRKTFINDMPSLTIDSAIPGPWQNRMRVWRCLFDWSSEPPNENDLSEFIF